MENNQQVARQRGEVVYTVAGAEVKLSFDIVRNYLTRGNGQVTDQELAQFIGICKYQQLNPFLNEAYLVKFAGSNPNAQMIVSKEAYFKRADACPNYDGIESGIIVERDGVCIDVEGCFYAPGEKLVGGWAKVYRTDRGRPITARVRLEEYDKGQSIWKEKKSTMIAKIAKVQALREAFPSQLGAMYTSEESNLKATDAEFEVVSTKVNAEVKAKANQEVISFDQTAEEQNEQQAEQPVAQQKDNSCPF